MTDFLWRLGQMAFLLGGPLLLLAAAALAAFGLSLHEHERVLMGAAAVCAVVGAAVLCALLAYFRGLSHM